MSEHASKRHEQAPDNLRRREMRARRVGRYLGAGLAISAIGVVKAVQSDGEHHQSQANVAAAPETTIRADDVLDTIGARVNHLVDASGVLNRGKRVTADNDGNPDTDEVTLEYVDGHKGRITAYIDDATGRVTAVDLYSELGNGSWAKVHTDMDETGNVIKVDYKKLDDDRPTAEAGKPRLITHSIFRGGGLGDDLTDPNGMVRGQDFKAIEASLIGARDMVAGSNRPASS